MKILTVAIPGGLTRQSRVAVWKYWHRPNQIDLRFIDPEDPFAYGKILKELWEAGEGFAVVEPDIVIRKDVADVFLNCPEPYCAFEYAWLTNIGAALGCTRFGSEFLLKYPTAMAETLAQNVSWRQLDVVLMRHILARKYREQPHLHCPPVEHLNPNKQLLPNADSTPLGYVPEW